MRKAALLAVFAILSMATFNRCKKDGACTPVPVADEKAAMVKFCADNGIVYTEHSSGILYQIITPGSGAPPTTSNQVFMYYRGTLLNQAQFDYQSDPTKTGWILSDLIVGWQKGLPLIAKGGRIKLVIPSSLAYGCASPSSTIPANSPLYFDITLTDIK